MPEADARSSTAAFVRAFTVRHGSIVRHALSGEREPMLRAVALDSG